MPRHPLPDVSFRVSKRALPNCRFATIPTVAQRLLKIAIDGTLQAPSVIDDPASVS
jgi:hypothetical protein